MHTKIGGIVSVWTYVTILARKLREEGSFYARQVTTHLFHFVGYSFLLQLQPNFLAVGAPGSMVPVKRHARFYAGTHHTHTHADEIWQGTNLGEFLDIITRVNFYA